MLGSKSNAPETGLKNYTDVENQQEQKVRGIGHLLIEEPQHDDIDHIQP